MVMLVLLLGLLDRESLTLQMRLDLTDSYGSAAGRQKHCVVSLAEHRLKRGSAWDPDLGAGHIDSGYGTSPAIRGDVIGQTTRFAQAGAQLGVD